MAGGIQGPIYEPNQMPAASEKGGDGSPRMCKISGLGLGWKLCARYDVRVLDLEGDVLEWFKQGGRSWSEPH